MYKSELAWQRDVYSKVFTAGHDAHFILVPDALGSVVRYGRQEALVSYSVDGTSIPVIKLLSKSIVIYANKLYVASHHLTAQ